VKYTKTLAAAAGVGLVAAGLLTATPATADPVGSPTFRDLAGMGSDTTERVMNALSDVITISGTKVIASYDATGSATVATKSDPACAAVARANGSSAGRNALQSSLAANAGAGNGCLDFARSSSAIGTYTSAIDMSWIPFAADSTSVAVRADGDVAREWTLADIISVYTCDPAFDAKPILPQVGSGSRASWLTTIGVTEAQITAGTYPCLKPVSAGGTGREYLQENDARDLKTDEMMPFSIGLFTVQQAGVVADLTANAVLAQIDGKAPQQTAPGQTVSRKLYNIIPTSKEAVAPWSTVFVGGSSLVCTNTNTIGKQGFGTTPDCGVVEARS
jgi:hypothetical protein